MRVTVTATLQAPGNDPVDMRWATDTTPVEAMVAIGQLLAQEDAGDPTPNHPTLLEIKVTVR